jgi:hypothetical protein
MTLAWLPRNRHCSRAADFGHSAGGPAYPGRSAGGPGPPFRPAGPDRRSDLLMSLLWQTVDGS